jgi:hypothetical protein
MTMTLRALPDSKTNPFDTLLTGFLRSVIVHKAREFCPTGFILGLG